MKNIVRISVILFFILPLYLVVCFNFYIGGHKIIPDSGAVQTTLGLLPENSNQHANHFSKNAFLHQEQVVVLPTRPAFGLVVYKSVSMHVKYNPLTTRVCQNVCAVCSYQSINSIISCPSVFPLRV